MKTLKFILLLITAVLVIVSCKDSPQKTRVAAVDNVAVFYTSDVANQVTAAAEVGVRYANTTYYDIDGMDSATLYPIITGLDTGTYHRIYIVCDTSKRTLAFADNKIKGTLVQYELTDALNSGIYLGVVPMATPLIVATAATKSKCEVAWEALFPNTTKPLVCEYQGLNVFSDSRGTANTAYTDSTIRDNSKSYTNDAKIGFWAYIVAGVGTGQSRQIVDNTSNILTVHPNWDKTPTSTTQYVVKKNAESHEIFYDKYTELYVLTYLSDMSDPTVIANWHKLMDATYNINNATVGTAQQDMDYLNNTVLAGGKKIFDYLSQQDDH